MKAKKGVNEKILWTGLCFLLRGSRFSPGAWLASFPKLFAFGKVARLWRYKKKLHAFRLSANNGASRRTIGG